MATQNITKDNFAAMVEKDGIVLVDFWASWCGPCQRFLPVFEEASERHPDVTFAKVNTDDEQALAGALEISSIPTVMAFRDSVLVFREAGAMTGAAIDDLISQIAALDMAEVKAKAQAEAEN